MKKTISGLLALLVLASCSGGGDKGEALRDTPPLESRSYDVHVFYYTWYGNPGTDGEYRGWDGNVPGRDVQLRRFEGGTDLASTFFPGYGPYSSADPKVVKSHIDQIAAAKIGVICVNWLDADSPMAAPVPVIMDEAARSNLKVCFRILKGSGGGAASFLEQAKFIADLYRDHEAFYTADRFGDLPLFYADASFDPEPEEWAPFLSPSGEKTVRGGEHDAVFVCVWKDREDGERILDSGFDGFYTWYAARRASWGSEPINFDEMNIFALDNRLLFIPTVSPGFDDTRLNPSNSSAVEIRGGGARYMETVQGALRVHPVFISINSFNDWLSGTQIEPAAPMSIGSYDYKHYGAEDHFLYLTLTARWIGGFSR